MSQHQINLAIQVLPLGVSKEEAYRIIDIAIAHLSQSGLQYVVCPFETVVEGPYDRVMETLDGLQQACFEAGAPEVLINMKLHRHAARDMAISDKMNQYQTA